MWFSKDFPFYTYKEGRSEAGILLTVKLNYRNTFFEEASLRKTIPFDFANIAD